MTVCVRVHGENWNLCLSTYPDQMHRDASRSSLSSDITVWGHWFQCSNMTSLCPDLLIFFRCACEGLFCCILETKTLVLEKSETDKTIQTKIQGFYNIQQCLRSLDSKIMFVWSYIDRLVLDDCHENKSYCTIQHFQKKEKRKGEMRGDERAEEFWPI